MKYTDLTNEELDGLVELVRAHKEGKVSTGFLNGFVVLLETAVFCRKTVRESDEKHVISIENAMNTNMGGFRTGGFVND